MRRDWVTLAFGVALVGIVVGLSLRQHWMRDREEPTRTAEPAAIAPAPAETDAPAPEAAPAAAPDTTAAAPPSRTRSPSAATAPPAAPDARASTAILQVQSDVPGASVFLDREFVGTTPLTLRGLAPGTRQVNVTATGHDGYAATVNLGEGANRVDVEFLKVRLDARLPVLHRHAMGTCQGMLTATPKGLVYDTPNTNDAFTLAFADIDEFEIDYLKKNLRVRRRSGKTWNFTNASADALFVFHRDVSKAREKLAATR